MTDMELYVLLVLFILSVLLNVILYAIVRINDREIKRLRRKIG